MVAGSNSLDSAIEDYLALAHKEFEDDKQLREFPSSRLRLILSKEELLLRLVDRLENSKQFAEVARATAQEYGGSGAEPRVSGVWESHAQDYFRLSGFYLDLLGAPVPRVSDVVEGYRAAFKTEHNTIRHLAPLEFVEFSEDVIDCGGFQIRRFSEQELDRIFRNPVKKVFYKWAYIASADIAPYWFLYMEETVPAKEPGTMKVVLNARVQISYSQYPSALQTALSRLALYNWGSPFTPRPERKALQTRYGAWDEPFRPHIPFVISCSDSMIDSPKRSPDLSVLAKEPFIDVSDEELGEVPCRGLFLNEQGTMEFQAFMQRCAAMDAKLRPYRQQWGFIDTALGFLLKGFTSDGLDQLLWHITAIEAVLGQKVEAGLTKLLLTRVSKVLGTKDEQKKLYKRFDNLYSFRSDLVHGNAGLATKEIYLGHLAEARDFARGIVLWALSYLCHVVEHLPEGQHAVPSREDLLIVLDMDTESRRQMTDLLRDIPAAFPNIEGWHKDT